MLRLARIGLKKGLSECRRQFRWERWNCSFPKKVTSKILKRRYIPKGLSDQCHVYSSSLRTQLEKRFLSFSTEFAFFLSALCPLLSVLCSLLSALCSLFSASSLFPFPSSLCLLFFSFIVCPLFSASVLHMFSTLLAPSAIIQLDSSTYFLPSTTWFLSFSFNSMLLFLSSN